MTTVESPATDPVARVVPRRVQLPKFGVELGPLLHLADERARLASLTFEHITVTPKGVTLGAEVSGVELGGDLPDEVIADIRRALVEFKVLVFRGQPLTSADHVGFARRFGELEVHPFLMGSAEHPELVRFEKGAESGGFENGWHHDVTWREAPSMGAVLRAVQVPPTGGDTLFADMAAAYDGLDDDTKQQLDGLEAAHDYLMAFGHFVEDEKKAEMQAQYPVVHHPVVRTHPESGRKLLFVNAYFTSHIVGLSDEESTALLRRLIQQAAITEYQYRVHWEPDTVVFWDNRMVQHYAASDYFPDVRIMERASIIGDRPV
ncbi:MAG: TauD/TfdA family dioxygenase [Acidimicrobiales bacterium]|nr:TauD/TfdA family dioxygenase [Acidimicrobiales bacterium]